MSSFDDDEIERLAEKLNHEYHDVISDKPSFDRAGASFFEKASDGKGLTEKRKSFLNRTWETYKSRYAMATPGRKKKMRKTKPRKETPPYHYVGYDAKRHKTIMAHQEKYLRNGKEVIRYRTADGRQVKLMETILAQRARHRRNKHGSRTKTR